MIERPEPTFLGYGLKQVERRPDWLKCPRVERIYSVSHCISTEPYSDKRYERWAFNKSGWYDTLDLAELDAQAGEQWGAFAFELYPLEFEGDAVQQVPVGTLLRADPRRLPTLSEPGFRFVGYDVVSGRCASPAEGDYAPVMAGFDCSPLSCNSLAPDHPVNENCLLDRWEDAVAAAARFAREEPEPGPYYIFGVYHRPS